MRKYRNCGVEDCKVAKSKDIAMLRSYLMDKIDGKDGLID